MKTRALTALLSVIIVILNFSELQQDNGFAVFGKMFSALVAVVIYSIYYAASRTIEKRSSVYEDTEQKVAACICLVLIFVSSFFK